MGCGGGKVVEEIRAKAQDDTLAYYARLEELAQGINPDDPLNEPHALPIYNQLTAFPGTLPEPGGLLDQPCLMMNEILGIHEAMQLRDRLAKHNTLP